MTSLSEDQLFNNSNNPLLCKVIHSQVLGVRKWTSLGPFCHIYCWNNSLDLLLLLISDEMCIVHRPVQMQTPTRWKLCLVLTIAYNLIFISGLLVSLEVWENFLRGCEQKEFPFTCPLLKYPWHGAPFSFPSFPSRRFSLTFTKKRLSFPSPQSSSDIQNISIFMWSLTPTKTCFQ